MSFQVVQGMKAQPIAQMRGKKGFCFHEVPFQFKLLSNLILIYKSIMKTSCYAAAKQHFIFFKCNRLTDNLNKTHFSFVKTFFFLALRYLVCDKVFIFRLKWNLIFSKTNCLVNCRLASVNWKGRRILSFSFGFDWYKSCWKLDKITRINHENHFGSFPSIKPKIMFKPRNTD